MAFEADKLVGNRYRILRHTSSGGMGATYLAEDTWRGQLVAIETRQLSSERQHQQIQREISLLGGLNHPNILRLIDYSTKAAIPYLVFENAPNGTLRGRHPYGSKVPLLTVVEYVNQVADALQYVHDHGIIHRDVKPENMLVGLKDEVLLSDFETAVVPQSSLYQQSRQDVVGTIAYMAPEQFQRRAVSASDQYALGIVVYEWLCGGPPFTKGNFTQLAYQHRLEPPPPLTAINPTIPRNVEQVVLRALEKDPLRRFSNMLAFAKAFEQATTIALAYPLFSAFPAEKTKAPLEGEEIEIDRTFATNPPTEQGSGNPYLYGTNASPDFDRTVSAQPLSEEPLLRRDVEEQLETQLSLYALANARLEADDRALIGKQYTLEAGLAQQRPENFVGEPFRVAVRNPAEPLLFHVMLHASPNVQLLGAWYQPLHYVPLNAAPQFITCPFRLTAAGESYLLVNFYRERQWLKSMRLEFEGIEQTTFSTFTSWR